MRVNVPKFIEREAKIVGPLTFKQFTYMIVPCGALFLLYFILPFYLVIILAIILIIAGTFLMFFKVEGISLPTVLKNFILFSSAPKLYIWRKKSFSPKMIKQKEKKEEVKEKQFELPKITKSKLKSLASRIET